MLLAFLDEFGHGGPFVARNHAKHNGSPVFGVAGFVMPDLSVRDFAMWFFQFKNRLLKLDFERRKCHPAAWEKKGTSVFTIKQILRYPRIRQAGRRLINSIDHRDGTLFYYGREKWKSPSDSNSNGLYTTVLAHSIRRIDQYAQSKRSNFVIVMDKHSSRRTLLETAAKTMFGSNPARCLLEPPFEVESHLYQTVQAADWLAAILGRVWAYRLEESQYSDHRIADNAYGDLMCLLNLLVLRMEGVHAAGKGGDRWRRRHARSRPRMPTRSWRTAG